MSNSSLEHEKVLKESLKVQSNAVAMQADVKRFSSKRRARPQRSSSREVLVVVRIT
jgi:hypothetical protein